MDDFIKAIREQARALERLAREMEEEKRKNWKLELGTIGGKQAAVPGSSCFFSRYPDANPCDPWFLGELESVEDLGDGILGYKAKENSSLYSNCQIVTKDQAKKIYTEYKEFGKNG